MLRTLAVIILVFSVAGVTCAQSTAPADQSETIKALVSELNELKARLATVEAKQAQPAPTSAEAAPVPAPSYTASAQSYEVLKGIKFQGFGEVDWRANDNHAGQAAVGGLSEGSNGNFATGDFDLFLTSRINDKTAFLSEIVFEAADAQSFNVNLARALLTYDHNDYFKVSLGR